MARRDIRGYYYYYYYYYLTELQMEFYQVADRLCGLVVRVPGYRSRGPGSISDSTRFSEK
jgi:hypothetical protein